MTNELVLGVGGRPAATADALLDLVTRVVAERGRELTDVTRVATLDRRAGHPGVRRLVELTGARLDALTPEHLATQDVDRPSATVARHVGTPSVAEAAVRAVGATPAGPPHTADDWVVVVGESEDLHHHGDREVEPGMLDLAVNVHAPGPPDFLRRALRAAVDDLGSYPDPGAATGAVASAHGVPSECVLLTHGAAEAFALVAQQPWQRPCVVHPQFTEPEAALVAHGHTVDRLLLAPEHGFRLGGERPAPGADLVIVGNPTNPTSRLHDPEDIAALAADTHGPQRLVVIDEAFLDSVEDLAHPVWSLTHRAAADRSFAVVRSLTKTYSIAGLRIGYVVAHPDIITRLARRRTSWPVSSLATAAAVACVSDEGRAYAAAVRHAVPARLAHLSGGLRKRGFSVVPDARGPFVLARRADAAPLRERLRSRGVAVRRGDTFPGLGREWLRITARDLPATDGLLDAIDTLA